MAFLITNTSSAVLPGSLGGHKLCLFVFWALPPFTLPVHLWATVLCMYNLPKQLSVICKYWHKRSVNKFLNPAWRRGALGWSVQSAVSLIAGNLLQQPDFHSAHTHVSEKHNWWCTWSLQILLSVNLCHLSLWIQACPTHPHSVHSLHPAVRPSEECVTTNTSKTRKWSLLIRKLFFLKERTVRLNCKHFCKEFFLKWGRSSNAANNAIFNASKINIIWFSSDIALLGR